MFRDQRKGDGGTCALRYPVERAYPIPLMPPPPYVLRTEWECVFVSQNTLDTPYFRQLARRAQAIHTKLTTCLAALGVL